MATTRRLATWGSAGALVLMLGSSAQAQLSSAEKKCIDGYNNKLRLVGQQAGKDHRTCIKNAGKHPTAEPNPDGCVSSDTPGKIAGKAQKVTDLFTGAPPKCAPGDPIQQGAATGNNAMISWSQDLVRDIFGDPISGVVDPGKGVAHCQDKAYQRAEQLFTEKLKGFRACKKAGLSAGTITNSVTLAATCMSDPQPIGIPDPSGKIQGKLTKLLDDINASCSASAIDYTVLPLEPFAGDCDFSSNPAQLGDCIEQLVECNVCRALNEADGMSVNCDVFDDGVNNGSCGVTEHTCVLDTTPATDSQIQIHIAALPVPLQFGLVGTLEIGEAAGGFAECDIATLNPVIIPCIGAVCIKGSHGCGTGPRWCGPGAGPALGVDVQSDGNAGACTSNAQCEANAPAACLGFGPNYIVQTAACTGHCSAGAGSACTTDAQCASLNENACNGPDPIGASGNICQIACIDTQAHGPSGPGDFQCTMGADLTVEAGPPCDGTDTTIIVGESCIPVSSQEASSLITDANFVAAAKVPNPPNVNDLIGQELLCPVVDSSVVTGLRVVGAVNFFGSALGDLAVGIKGTCN